MKVVVRIYQLNVCGRGRFHLFCKGVKYLSTSRAVVDGIVYYSARVPLSILCYSLAIKLYTAQFAFYNVSLYMLR